jgi:predicted nucleic acid-binding protein
MALALPANNAGALVVDANVSIAICAREADKHTKVDTALAHYLSLGYALYAPGAVVTETLYILCRKVQDGLLTPDHHRKAIERFITLMQIVLPPPGGDASLIRRAEEIRSGYGCSRSADGLYIALAEALSVSGPTTLLTFDTDLQKQAARNAPTVSVHLLSP